MLVALVGFVCSRRLTAAASWVPREERPASGGSGGTISIGGGGVTYLYSRAFCCSLRSSWSGDDDTRRPPTDRKTQHGGLFPIHVDYTRVKCNQEAGAPAFPSSTALPPPLCLTATRAVSTLFSYTGRTDLLEALLHFKTISTAAHLKPLRDTLQRLRNGGGGGGGGPAPPLAAAAATPQPPPQANHRPPPAKPATSTMASGGKPPPLAGQNASSGTVAAAAAARSGHIRWWRRVVVVLWQAVALVVV